MAQNDRTIFANRENNPLESLNKMGSFFVGTDPTSFGEIEMDAYTGGYGLIYWIKLPSWFEQDDDLKYFKVLTQKTFHALNGISDVELQESSQNYGFAGNEVSAPTGITRGNTDFTLSFHEYSGTPNTKMFNKWITMIRDKNTGIALYPKLYNVEYSARNHTGQLLYIALRPDVTNAARDNIEKAFIWTNVYPLNINWGELFNVELGNQDQPSTLDVNFKGVPLEGEAVNAYARKILENEILQVSEDNGNGLLFLDSLMKAGDQGTEVLTQGLLKEIYNPDNK